MHIAQNTDVNRSRKGGGAETKATELTVNCPHLSYPHQHHPVHHQQQHKPHHVVDPHSQRVRKHKVAQVVEVMGSRLKLDINACFIMRGRGG